MVTEARLIIVEDEAIVALDLAEQLRGVGYTVVGVAAKGEDAVRMVTDLIPDLVLMDVHLVGAMDGIAAATMIAEQVDLPVVYMTGYSDDETLARARITQPYGYVIKPVDIRELHIAIEISIQLHETHRRLVEAQALLRLQAQKATAALEELLHLENLKGQFVRNAAHELRTPLTLILGYAEMLATGELGALTPNQKSAAEIIARRSGDMHLMLGDMGLLLEATQGRMEPEPVDLSVVLGHVVHEYHSKMRTAELQFHVDIPSEMPLIMAPPAQLYRVISHLLSNAMKFTPAGGAVSIIGRCSNSRVEVEVVDTGPGIPPQEHERIFQWFYQIDGSPTRRHGGLGIGLALAKETVAALGGDVTVESQIGRGSTFRVSLPVIPGSTVNAESAIRGRQSTWAIPQAVTG